MIKENIEGRVEGIFKVTGAAKYSAEYELPDMAYGVLVGSKITSGKITKLNAEDALSIGGVLDVLSFWNKPEVKGFLDEKILKSLWITTPIFHTDTIHYADQYIALVVADTLENATYAASLITAEYEVLPHKTNFDTAKNDIKLIPGKKERGTIDAWKDAPYMVEQEYGIAMEVHSPMEPHATIAHWEAEDKITLYDKNQGVNSVQGLIASVFQIPKEKIHVISEFVGGGFGAGLRMWPHTVAAAMAAKQLNRPVKIVLTRAQMFTQVGFRPQSWQKIKIGADNTGKFLGAIHQAKNATATFNDFNDNVTGVTKKIYAFENLQTENAIVPLNIPVPTWMRGPGDASGCFGMECAIDELSYLLDIDPVKLRLQNIQSFQMETGKPWSTHYLNECLTIGAEQIGWKNRMKAPSGVKEGDWHIGYGVGIGLWDAGRGRASASLSLSKDGQLTISSAMTDIGTGTGQAMLNIVHKETGIDKSNIKVRVGDSDLPPAGSQGGSTGLSSISGAVVAAANSLKTQIAKILQIDLGEKSEMLGLIKLTNQGISFNEQITSFEEFFRKAALETLFVQESSGPGAERDKYGFVSCAAHFCKVKVNKQLGKVKIERFVSVADVGTVINTQQAENQVIGAVVGGIGMALLENQEFDHNYGRQIGNDFGGYHFAVNASAPIIEVSFINKPDPNINPSGAKGLGEVGIIGCAAAIANAIYNAIGKRCYDLPITPDKIIG